MTKQTVTEADNEADSGPTNGEAHLFPPHQPTSLEISQINQCRQP